MTAEAVAHREDHPPPWHSSSREEVLRRLDSTADGLSREEAAARLRRYGPNALRPAQRTPWWRILYRQVRSIIVALLVVAAGGAFLVGDHLEGLAIVAVLVLNTALGFAMESWAERAMESLRRMEVQRATVRRGGRGETVDARELVPGDVVILQSGEAIAADARMLTATELATVEAPLTGEPTPTPKRAAAVGGDKAGDRSGAVPLAERSSMVYKGTLVATGGGEAVVVATGRDTEIGRIAELVVDTEKGRTPLEQRLDQLGRRLVGWTLAVTAVVVTLGIARGLDAWLMVETGIALAISAVPEGLPVVATITLAVGMRRMAERRALVRRLPAVETLGAATLVCSDKTGTLTSGEMTATRYLLGDGRRVDVGGAGRSLEGEMRQDGRPVDPRRDPDLEAALRIGLLTNRAALAGDAAGGARGGDTPGRPGLVAASGDPTDVALLVAGLKAGLDPEAERREMPEVAEVPFSSQRRLMATLHRRRDGGMEDGGLAVLVKGAPSRLLELAETQRVGGRVVALTEGDRRRWAERNAALAGEGLRVLAFASRQAPAGSIDSAVFAEADLAGLTFEGLVGISDPPARGVAETIRRLAGAGVRSVMITGDQAVTAAAVGRELGLLKAGGEAEDEVVHGSDLAARGHDGGGDHGGGEIDPGGALARRVAGATVFSRVSPEDKLRIVELFQRRGEVVAMLGDGVNDAPALKQADIGVAMGGRGTDVAKETADLVLGDDRFETVAVAVEEGRVIFDNIRKFVFYLFSCNLSEILVLLLASLAALPLPLLPLQLLWLNLVTDVFPALALAGEPAEPGVMERPPRDPRSAILSRGFLGITGAYALLLSASTLASFVWALEMHGLEPRHAGTVAFMTLALTQLLHVFNARNEGPVLLPWKGRSNPWVWAALVVTVALQLLAVYQPGLAAVLGTRPLTAADWTVILVAAAVPLALGQAWKLWKARRTPGAGAES